MLASKGYPEKPVTGDIITGIADAEKMGDVTVYHAGTKLDDKGNVITAGGRVLNIVAIGNDMQDACERAYLAASKIDFPGKQLRTDIALNS